MWHRPQIDLFGMKFNNKLTYFMSPVPEPLAWSIQCPPVVIQALAPTLDKSFKSDRSLGAIKRYKSPIRIRIRSLCPIKVLCYYFDRTSDLRQNKELIFVSFKKVFDKDISPATISSWIKQTVILCYELSDQEAHTLHQVKAHDVRAFAASKAFQSGVSLDQILSPAIGSHTTPSHSSI